MAFADPQSIVFPAPVGTISLPRTGFAPNSGVYTSADGSAKLTISHAYNKRTRRVIRLDGSKVAADPLMPATNVPYKMNAYLVVDVPKFGFSVEEQTNSVNALVAYLSASSGANVAKLLGGES